MKPRRPTESDLLAIVQNGFQEQLPKDREAQAPANAPAPSAAVLAGVDPTATVPMVRITLAIPENLRYRLKLAMLDHRRKHRSRITQDEFCAQAIAAHLDQQDRCGTLPAGEDPLAAFLRDCLNSRGMTKPWLPRAKALLAALQPHSRPAPQPAGRHPEPGI